MRHLVSCIVVTSPEDEDTKAVARSVPGVDLFETTAFTENGAFFNKGLSFERAWQHFGRDGQWLIWDADTLLPPDIDWGPMQPDWLYGARRRHVADASQWSDDCNWKQFPLMVDGAPVGFFQLFSGSAPNLVDRRPWYNVNSPHAGLGDAEFLDSFSPAKRKILPIEVLHFGERDQNWWGLSEHGQNIMKAYCVENGFQRALKDRGIDPKIVEKVGEIPKRVEVPGYPMSSYQMAFERRAEVRRQMQQARRPGG